MPKSANTTLVYRVGRLEKSVDDMEDKLDTILTNDLPHLQQEMESLKVRINVLTAINVGAILLVAVLLKFL